MMNLSNLVLLPVTTYGQPSGNYDGTSASFIGNAIPAAAYYRGQGQLQTIPVTTANVLATITVQASLNDNAQQAAWFDVGNVSSNIGNTSNAITGVTTLNVPGNFVWLRARVDNFSAGTLSANVIY